MHVFRLASTLSARALAAVICAAFWLAPVRSASADYIATELYTLLPPSGYTNSDLEVTAEMGPSISGQTVGIAQHVVNNQAMDIRSELWDRTGTRLMLDPPTTGGFIDADVQTTDGVQQVGFGHVAGSAPDNFRAVLWNGVGPAINLHPANFDSSFAAGISGTQQVGSGMRQGINHALLWTGTAASAIDLSPTNLTAILSSNASNTDGTHQVGSGETGSTSTQFHALLWSGTAASAVDLNPTALPGIVGSQALGVGGGQEVGVGITGSAINHAMVWSGTADSAVDLAPSHTESWAIATNGVQQVGWGFNIAGGPHALLWSGTAASLVDLHNSLPPGFVDSVASSIDPAGNVFGIAIDASGNYHAIEWTPVPEPSALALLIAATALGRRRR